MTAQVILDVEPLFTLRIVHPAVIWLDSLIFPAYAAILSVLILILHFVLSSEVVKKLFKSKNTPEGDSVDEEPASDRPNGVLSTFKNLVASHGGAVIYSFEAVQCAGCLALFGLFLASVILPSKSKAEGIRFGYTTGTYLSRDQTAAEDAGGRLSTYGWLQISTCVVFAYASILSLVSISTCGDARRITRRHLWSVLLVTWAVAFYRDVWPLATYTERPKDGGALLWVEVVILTLAAVIVPLFAPRQYIPVDPKEPMEPNPEQTTSWWSLTIWSFLDGIIFEAYRLPHFPYDSLPPLADYDHAKNLTKKAFPVLDPFLSPKRPYLFFGLLHVFRYEYALLCLLIIVKAVSGFASPIGLFRLLRYLETEGEGEDIKPWVWVIWLFLGPMISSFAWQGYIFVSTGSFVRTEAILTQLVFHHSLRIRMKAEAAEGASSAASTPAPATPDTVSIAESPADGSSDRGDDETIQASVSSVPTSSTKGKQKAKDTSSPGGPASDKPQGQSTAENLVGKINNLISSDLNNITEARDFLFVIVYAPLQLVLCAVFLYKILGWSSFVGLAVMLAFFPIPGFVAQRMQAVQKERMKRSDARVQTVTETMNVIRMVKLFGWETKMSQRLSEKREEELTWLWRRQVLDLVNGNLNYVIPLFTMIATYATYTLILKQDLSASKVFSSMAVFDMSRDQLHMVFYMIPAIISGKVSLDRIDKFITDTELLDSFAQKSEPESLDLLADEPINTEEIGFRDATFSWSNAGTGALTPSKRKFRLKLDGEVFFKRRAINLVVGPTGSGKTSLLMALLGELHFIPSGPSSWFNLPRSGGVAYAAQESWVQNETIKENILFGTPYDETRYNKVIYQCGLKRDLTLFEAGDRTEVGEKGLTLSGGQKARITLARAVYSSAEILLLDDVLAALDVHTSKWIVDKCFSGDLLHGRTVILVTHNVALISPISKFVVSLGVDGRIANQGTVAEVLAKDHEFKLEADKDQEMAEKAEDEIDSESKDATKKEADGKLIVAEEVEEGHVSWAAFKLFISSMGGAHSLVFWTVFLFCMLLTDLLTTVQTWLLGQWARQYDELPSSEVNVPYYLSVYSVLLFIIVFIYSAVILMYYYGWMRSSRTIHQKLIESVLGTTLRWLDTTPTSRIITRATVDITAVDSPIPQSFNWLVELTMGMVIRLLAVVYVTPVFAFPGIFIGLLGGWIGRVYMKAQLSVKREMSNAKAPVVGHFGAAITGLTSIRAYGAQQAVRDESLRRIDRYTRAARTFYNLNRWICVRIDALSGLFSAGLAAYLIYGPKLVDASTTGFSLNMAVGFSSMILWYVRILNNFEVSGNSLERIQGYINIEQEPKPTPEGEPPAYWPASGDLRVEGLSARYSPDGPKVLHGLNFHIKSGERVGVVGRTGSGKSSLTLSLLRCIYTEGNVYYDGLPTSSINLDDLRSKITIIPQIPELLSGTLRQNLDPFEDYDDAVLNDALRAAGLQSLQNDNDETRINLDSVISTGGGNLSVGQRQILALARAIIRGSKLLILDEATSAIDYETDTVIQSSLRNELGGDVTLLTVAHRLQTIMDADKIMVLDAGRLAEFDSPSNLLKKENGMLRALVDESGDKDRLYAMAEGKKES